MRKHATNKLRQKVIVPIDLAIVTHNRDRQLLRCISYLLKGSKLPKNVIIVHSQEPENITNKEKIFLLLKSAGVRLNYISVPHLGISYSRNIALENVKNPYFAFIDDDEYPSKKWIEFAYKFLIENKDVQVLTGPKICTNQSNYWSRVWFELYKDSFNFFGEVDFATSSNSFYQTEFIKKNQIFFDSSFKNSSEDRVFSFLIKKSNGKILFHKNLTDHHDFRDTMVGLINQWYGYGETMARFHYLYLNLRGLTLFRSLKDLLIIKKFLKRENVFMLFGFLVADISFIVGFIKSVSQIKSHTN